MTPIIATDTVDLTFLSNLCDNNKAFMKEMAETFMHDIPEHLAYLNQQLEEGNWKEVERAAHKMKPAAQFMGLQQTLEIFKEVEANSKQSCDYQLVKSLIQTATTNILHAVSDLQTQLDNDFEA